MKNKTNSKETFRDLLSQIDDHAIALLTPTGESLTYGELIFEASTMSNQLSQHGITRDDRVAILLPNGPSMVISFLATIFTACAAPLNPKSRAREIDFYLNDLNASAIITDEATFPSEESELAKTVDKLFLDGPVGNLNLSTNKRLYGSRYKAPRLDDAALVLHTSGTTSLPKLVPLRQGHLVHSAANIARSLELGPADRT
jgi:acyl-CoA synthetase (AMP-forming)/AMP-acid ligase II